jgi:hypothetical protein
VALEQRAELVLLPVKPSTVRPAPLMAETRPSARRDSRSLYFTHGAYAAAGPNIPKLKVPGAAPDQRRSEPPLARAATSDNK